MAYIETPQTDAGNSIYLPNGHGLEDISVENTFISPTKNKGDVISLLRNGRGISLKTPRSRVPFVDRRNNLPNAHVHGEFSPLLRSVAKNSHRSGKLAGIPETPAFIKNGYREDDSSALPGMTPGAYSEDTRSSAGGIDDKTPVPQIASSSVQSTPFITLPKRNGEGVLTDQGNMMALREQENIVDKIEKENFGLKLKIHYLEESLRKSGPGFNEAALRENTDLKVDKITMQKDLARAKKTLDKAEREVKSYREQLEKAHEQMKRKFADQKLAHEIESLRNDLTAKTAEIQDLKDDIELAAAKDTEVEGLKGDIEDLEADVRERDRLLDDRDEEIEKLNDRLKMNADELAEVYDEANAGKQKILDLEENQQNSAKQGNELREVYSELERARHQAQDLDQDVEQVKSELKEAKMNLSEAEDARRKAEEDLDELRDEMSNKSINSKGLSRQLEEKLQRLNAELTELRDIGSKSEKEARRQEQRLRDENERLERERQEIEQRCSSLVAQVQDGVRNLERKSEEKDLLHSRHDALTAESQSLQKEMARAQARQSELKANLEAEREHALVNDRQLREEAKTQIDLLSDQIDSLQRELDDRDSQQAAELDLWESQRRGLESERDRANEQAASLQRSINRLQEAEGTLSGREHKLQEALESEKQRHASQEASLKRDLQELDADISEKRKSVADLKSELSRVNEELRVTKRNESSLEEKMQALEDEVNVLQDSLDEEAERAKEEVGSLRREAESLKRQLHTTKQELLRSEAARDEARARFNTFQGDVQAEHGSQEQLISRLRDVESQLQQIRTERQSLQDKLASNSIELHSLRNSLDDVEAERDEVKNQLSQMESQLGKTTARDQEKLELRKAKLKLETELSCLRNERDALLEKNDVIDHELEAEIKRAGVEEGRLRDECNELQRKLRSSSETRDRDLSAAKITIQRLESRAQEFQSRLENGGDGMDHNAEISLLRKDLATARSKETEFVQRESAQKEAIREMKQNVSRLERQIHEAEVSRFAADSPKSSVGGSARKNEIVELRNQLIDAHQQLKEARSKSRDAEREFRRKISEAESEARAQIESVEQEREQLEMEMTALRQVQESSESKLTTAEKTVTRLRGRIQTLESSLHAARNNTTEDRTMADERKDLHEMLKDAKLEAEDLQLQISTQESNLKAAATREREYRLHVQRIRNERSHQQKKSSALATELEHLQSRYERAVNNLSRQQKQWEAERKAMNSKVRFVNTSISENRDDKEEFKELQLVVKQKEKRHVSELNGMATQIQWLRWKLEREADFRNCLVFEKCYLSTQIKMFEACNALDLEMFKQKLGIDATKYRDEPVRKPHIRTWALMVVFTLRCKRYADEWREQKKVKTVLNKALEEARRGMLRKRIEAKGLK